MTPMFTRSRVAGALAGPLLLAAASPVHALPCQNYDDQLHVLWEMDVPELVQSVTPFGQYTLMPAGLDGVLVLDGAETKSPSVIGSVSTPGAAYAAAVDGRYAYVADYAAGLTVVDLVDPANPAVVTTLPTPAHLSCIARIGDRVAVPAVAGLQLISVSDPLHPELLDVVPAPDPSSYLQSVITDGAYLYVIFSNEYAGYSDIGVIDPSVSPAVLRDSHRIYADRCRDIAVDGTRLFVVPQTDDFEATFLQITELDVSNPDAIGLVGSTAPEQLGGAGLVAEGNTLYMGNFRIYDLPVPGAPVLRSALPVSPGALCTKQGNVAIFAAGHGLAAVDLSHPYFVTPFEGESIEGQFIAWLIADGLAIGTATTTTGAGVWIVDLSDPTYATVLSHLPLTYGPVKDGNLLYVLSSTELEAWGIADPSAPKLLGSVGGVGTPSTLARDGSLAVLTSSTGVHVVDLTNPTSPQIVGSLALSGARQVSIWGGRAYVMRWIDIFHTEMTVVDVTTDPSQPSILTQVPLVDSWPFFSSPAIAVHDHYGYTIVPDATGQLFLRIFDLDTATPATPPPIVGSVPVDFVASLRTLGNSLWYGDVMYDLTDPVNPARWTEVAPGGNYVFGFSDEVLVAIVPGLGSHPVVTWPPPCRPAAVAAPAVPAGGAMRLAVRPNPTSGRATVSFTLDAPARARVDVYDVTGRRVAGVTDGRFDRGGSVAWNGTGSDGRPLASGVYFVRLATPTRSVSEKLVLLR